MVAEVHEKGLAPLSSDFLPADFGDQRLSVRLWRILDTLAEQPGASFPVAMGSDEALEGFYRFVNNARVTPERILKPHVEETCVRAAGVETILAVHDTTEVEYAGEVLREGLGRISGNGQGYFAHATLAVGADGLRKPLGLLGLRTWSREWLEADAPKRARTNKAHANPDGESCRWREQVDEVEALAEGRFKAIHVMDREADSFELLAHMVGHGISFVVRGWHDRQVISDDSVCVQRLGDALVHTLPVVEREVFLSRRSKKNAPPAARRKHPPRDARMARLQISATRLEVVATQFAGRAVPRTLALNCVHVREVDAPEGVEPVDWRLWTVLPTDTPEQILFVVDVYRARWIIEEFFKALKTGCALERRQQESDESLLNVLALLIPVAWRMLLIRHLARHTPEAPASEALTDMQLDVLRAFATKPLASSPTVRQALLAVAALGGHLRNNGEPGWIVLGRGFEKLTLLEAGWRAAREKM